MPVPQKLIFRSNTDQKEIDFLRSIWFLDLRKFHRSLTYVSTYRRLHKPPPPFSRDDRSVSFSVRGLPASLVNGFRPAGSCEAGKVIYRVCLRPPRYRRTARYRAWFSGTGSSTRSRASSDLNLEQRHDRLIILPARFAETLSASRPSTGAGCLGVPAATTFDRRFSDGFAVSPLLVFIVVVFSRFLRLFSHRAQGLSDDTSPPDCARRLRSFWMILRFRGLNTRRAGLRGNRDD